jgi:D-cysteine desulfhydrase
MTQAASSIPLVRRFPSLAALPRAALCVLPTPVQRAEGLAPGLWIKREDLSAESLGGNKVRSLEFLLGGARRGDRVVTVGAAGSTHALATAVHARRLGATAFVYRWQQEMTGVSERVAERIVAESNAPVSRTVVGAYLRAFAMRLRGARWIPAGGSSAIGVLGQVNAALELVDQVNQGLLPIPDRIVLPLGTGGTAAGLALGLAIAGLETKVIGVRVVPRIVANSARVRRLAQGAARIIEGATNTPVRRPADGAVQVLHEFYGGAYGRETPGGARVARRCIEQTGIALDPTYTAKALTAALMIAERDRGTTLFWLSFDGRWLARA